MSGTESIGAFANTLNVLKDIPLWLLTAVAVFLFVCPFVPGVGDLLSATAVGWIPIAGIFFTILAVCRLGNVLISAIRTMWLRREEGRTVHLTLNDSHSFWHVAKQPDGSMVTQFALKFMAKNRTTAPLYLLKARVIRPKLHGEAIQDLVYVRAIKENLYGSAEVTGNYIPAAGLLPVSVHILVRDQPKQTTGRLKMIIGVTDESGNETRVKFNLKGVP